MTHRIIFTLITTVFYVLTMSAQIDSISSNSDPLKPTANKKVQVEKVYRVAEEMPRFPGCEHLEDLNEKKKCSTKELLMFIYSNINYPEDARESGLEGSAVVHFIVEKDGSITNIEIARKVSPSLDAECLRVVNFMADQKIWIPAKMQGEVVKFRFALPVKFKLDSNNKRIKKRRSRK